MKKTVFGLLHTVLFASALLFTSCQSETIVPDATPDKVNRGTLNLQFTLATAGGAATRATTITPPNPLLSVNSGREDNLTELRVLIFDATGKLLKNELLSLTGSNPLKATVKMERPAGAIDFYFVGNESKLEPAEKALLANISTLNDLLTKTDKMSILREANVKSETLTDYPYPYTAYYKGITIPQGETVQFPKNPVALVHATAKVKVTIINEAMSTGKEILVRVGSIDRFAKKYRLFYKPDVSFDPVQSDALINYELPMKMAFNFTPSETEISTNPPSGTVLEGNTYYGYKVPYRTFDVTENAQPEVKTYYISETLATKPDDNVADETERYKKQPSLYILLFRPKQDGSSIAYMSQLYNKATNSFPAGTEWYKNTDKLVESWEYKNAGFIPISCEKAAPAPFPSAYSIPASPSPYAYDVFNATELGNKNVSHYSLFRNHQYNITVRVKGWPGEIPMEIQPSIVGFTEVNTEVVIGG